MSDLIIKIGDDTLDLSQGETIAITKQAAKVGEFSTVLADGTNEVRIPATANNRLILQNANLIQSESNKPYERLPATLIQEGYETLQDGYAIVQESKGDFSLQVIGGNGSFFSLIKDLNLRDLDLSEYDHFWTNENVFLNRNNSAGFIYALFEQSDQPADPTLSTYGSNLYAVQTEKLFFSFFIKTLIDKIFSAQVYNFLSDITTADIYQNLALFNGEEWNRGTDSTYLNISTEGTVDQLLEAPLGIATTYPLIPAGQITAQNSTYFDEPTLNDYLLNGQGRPVGIFTIYGSKVLVPDATRVTLAYTLVIDNPNSTGTTSINVGIAYTTDSGEAITGFTLIAVPGINTWNITDSFDLVKTPISTDYFDANETGFFVSISGTYSVGLSYATLKASSTASYSFEFISAYDVTTTLPYNFLRGISGVPDMKQGDFLKDIARIFQWIFDTDEINHTVTARRFDEIKDNIPQAIDLSDKLHADTKTHDIKFRIEGFAQTNNLKYLPDDITKYDAKGFINVADATLQAERDYITMSQFAASSPVLRFDTKNVPYVPLFNEDGLPTNGLADRLLLVRRETFGYNINFNRSTESPTDWPTSDVTFAYFTEAGNNNSLDFPTIINRFYQTVIDMNVKAKTIECLMNLNIKDVNNYDPFTPVYISFFNNYFYWQKLSNYVKGKKTSVQLIKI